MNPVWKVGSLTSCLLLWACGPGESGLEIGEERVAANERETTAAMIAEIKSISLQRDPSGLVKRFNQVKSLGCFDAEFQVSSNLPETLQQGIFVAGKRYPANLRFANATEEDDRKKDFRGLSIKLNNIEGDSLWGTNGEQDFLLNSYPALFAANPEDFLSFIEATGEDKLWRYFIHPGHWYSLGVVLRGREEITNPFAIRYWSTTPFRFGANENSAVKYSVTSCNNLDTSSTVEKGHDFLSSVMTEQLARGPVCLSFKLQFQTNPDTMPIENAAIVWEESESPFVEVAQIHIQNSESRIAEFECESMTFNPWQSLASHRPLGGINRVRKEVYAEIGKFRQQENHERALH